MKKTALFVLIITALAFGASSCKKSNTGGGGGGGINPGGGIIKPQTCKCTEYYQGLYNDSEIIDAESEGLQTCTEVTDRLNERYGGNGYSYECVPI